MTILGENCYKEALRKRVKEIGATHRNLRLKQIAEKIPVQYTYLSKALRDPRTHLNEDHLYSLCRILELLPEETDYIFLLRSLATAQDSRRREHLQKKIVSRQAEQKLEATSQKFDSRQINSEMDYLFDPLCVLVHVSLFIKEYQENPRALCRAFSLDPLKLNEILKKLHQAHFIGMDSSGRITQVLNGQIHYGTDHPLMRVHQMLLRQQSLSQLQRLGEESKHSIMTTFSSEPEVFQKIRERFQIFLKDVENLALRSRSLHTYQLNFDLFRWI